MTQDPLEWFEDEGFEDRLADAFGPTPAPPPVAGVWERIDAHGSRRSRWPVFAAAAALAAVLLGGAYVLSRGGDTPAHADVVLAGPGIEDAGTADGNARTARRPAEVRWRDESARAVLDAGARLVPGPSGARLLAGRAWFEVRPRAAAEPPFVVETEAGPVRVHGTSFEVDLTAGLRVEVATGAVEVRGDRVAAGTRWHDGRVEPAGSWPGAWFRTPGLRTVVPTEAKAREPVTLVLEFTNPGHVPISLERRSGAPASLWVTVTAPDGTVHDLPAADEPWAGGEPLLLEGLTTRRVPVRFLHPFASRGSYRVGALYRPADGPSVRADEVEVEVH